MQYFVTKVKVLYLSPGNTNKIDSYMYSSYVILKPVIECHHLAHPFQKGLLLLQSTRK